MTDLGTLGGWFSDATAINDAGQVAGYGFVAGDAGQHAFLCDGSVLADLGTLGGSFSSAAAINDARQVVGQSYTAGVAADYAFFYQHGSMSDLGTLGGTYSVANAINDAGRWRAPVPRQSAACCMRSSTTMV